MGMYSPIGVVTMFAITDTGDPRGNLVPFWFSRIGIANAPHLSRSLMELAGSTDRRVALSKGLEASGQKLGVKRTSGVALRRGDKDIEER